jgi:hypothetical protein
MQLNQALKTISKIYVNGVVEFYSNFQSDPWQAAHDRLEQILLLYEGKKAYFEKIGEAAELFVAECSALIETYRVTHPEQLSLISVPDAFQIADEEKVRYLTALSENSCLNCESTENVRIAKHPKTGQFKLFCKECVS